MSNFDFRFAYSYDLMMGQTVGALTYLSPTKMADTIQLFTSRGQNGMTMPRILYERLCEHILSMVRENDAISLADLVDRPEQTASDLEQFINKEMLPLYLLNVKIDLHARKILHISLLGRTQIITLKRSKGRMFRA